jgi:crotonobetainyl-CoA:carnitine CoA-transferase CaiB-like acyl-CoA transferase
MIQQPSGALDGLRVVELASYVSGPYASRLLADLGADVIKVEAPPHGDPFRNWGAGNYSPTFCSANSNKRSLRLDLQTDDGRDVFCRLVDRADVLIHNLRPGAMERLGLDYESLAGRNEGLIFCAVSGFGEDGPYAARPGYDTIGQALSGLLGLLTDLDAPEAMGVSLSDHITGVFASYGVLAALAARTRTGKGQKVETSLLQATVSLLGENMARYLATAEVPTRQARTRMAQVYALTAGDGKPFVIHLSSPPKFWAGLARAFGRPDLLSDPRFANREGRIHYYHELRDLLADESRSRPRAHWLAKLTEADVPCAAINTFAETFADPQVQHLDLLKVVEHPTEGPVHLVGAPIRMSSTPPRLHTAPPTLGEHSREILAELGYDQAQVDRFVSEAVI